jgi:hypothetical protein
MPFIINTVQVSNHTVKHVRMYTRRVFCCMLTVRTTRSQNSSGGRLGSVGEGVEFGAAETHSFSNWRCQAVDNETAADVDIQTRSNQHGYCRR